MIEEIVKIKQKARDEHRELNDNEWKEIIAIEDVLLSENYEKEMALFERIATALEVRAGIQPPPTEERDREMAYKDMLTAMDGQYALEMYKIKQTQILKGVSDSSVTPEEAKDKLTKYRDLLVGLFIAQDDQDAEEENQS